MARSFGPILHARGEAGGALHYTVLATTPKISSPGDPEARPLGRQRDLTFYAADFSVAAEPQGQRVTYRVGGEDFCFSAPGRDDRLRIAFASCNGTESDENDTPALPARNAMWKHLNERHAAQSFHLLIQGGDQIYADSVWRRVPALAAWKDQKRRVQYGAPFPAALAEETRSHYFDAYLAHWSRPELRTALATLPQLMMWDDHDIFDGWGSWNDNYQRSPTYQGVFAAARTAFNLFQRGLADEVSNLASWALRLGDTGIIAPDLRSLRTRSEVLGVDGWQWLQDNLRKLSGCRELVVVSTVPLATGHFSALDPILTGLPSAIMKHIPHRYNPKQFADDIHDQWRVPAHRREWFQVISELLDFGERNHARVTILSGEIHLGARSTIKRGAQVINQYIASGIAHQPAHPLVTWACEWLSRGTQNLPGGVEVRMERFFNEQSRKRYLAARNWLELELDPRGENQAIWHAEDHRLVTHHQPLQS